MSSSATHERPSLARRLPAVAAPVLGVAATAFAVIGTPATSMAATTATAHHDSTTRVASVASKTVRTTAKHVAKHAAPAQASYTVKSGDTLSSIARHFYQDSKYWPVLFRANQHQIQYADVIQVGQVFTVPAKPATIPAPPSSLSAPAPAPVHQSAPVEQSAPTASTSAQSAPVQASTVSTSGDSSFQACVISRESGGNSQVMNGSGHYGLYQFSASTWAAYGGNPADFGNASVSEQNQVFDNAMAQGGESNWAPYDGC